MPLVKSKFPPLPALPPMNVHTFMFESAPGNLVPDDHVLYVDGLTGETRTRRAFIERVRDAATALAAPVADGGLGLSFGTSAATALVASQPKEMVAVFSPNCLDYPVVVHACLSLTVPFALLPAKPTTSELVYLLEKSKATRFFVHPKVLDQAHEAAKKVGLPTNRIYLFGGRNKTHLDLGSLIAHVKKNKLPRQQVVSPQRNTLAYLVFSSGTSGLPKGVMISHDNVVTSMLQMIVSFQESVAQHGPPPPGPVPIWLIFLPIYHSFGLHYVLFRPLLTPNTLVVLPRWNIDDALKAIHRHKITHLPLVPSIVHQLVHSPKTEKADLSSVVWAGSGAAYLPPALSERAKKLLGVQEPLLEGYGLSEATIGTLFRPVNGMFGIPPVPKSTGILLPGYEARIVRDDGSEADYNEVGELWLKCGTIAMGYWNNEKATSETFLPGGWLRTGDRFRVDETETFYYEDRMKDTLKISGAQVAPAEIEKTILEQPDGLVDDVAVAGVSGGGRFADERVPRAWIVLSAKGRRLGETEVRRRVEAFTKEHLSRYKWITGGIEVVAEIPKNPSGKTLRRVLVDAYEKKTVKKAKAKL